ncbi:hypothetical protein GGS24DRAFT_513034 [Hypoxylon argillaceum]|nr:hypothetical protein GGS24DRAFT_513034 [Hypoxylon argillaceum]
MAKFKHWISQLKPSLSATGADWDLEEIMPLSSDTTGLSTISEAPEPEEESTLPGPSTRPTAESSTKSTPSPRPASLQAIVDSIDEVVEELGLLNDMRDAILLQADVIATWDPAPEPQDLASLKTKVDSQLSVDALFKAACDKLDARHDTHLGSGWAFRAAPRVELLEAKFGHLSQQRLASQALAASARELALCDKRRVPGVTDREWARERKGLEGKRDEVAAELRGLEEMVARDDARLQGHLCKALLQRDQHPRRDEIERKWRLRGREEDMQFMELLTQMLGAGFFE